jgi:hypothetical protein
LTASPEVSDSAEATVQQRTFEVIVTPASVNLNVAETQSFSAVARDENGYDLVTQPTVFAWASADVAIATVAPDTALTTIATAVANGTVAVTATDTAAGVTGNATVRVGPTTGVYWLGGSGSWNDAGNWSSGTVPTAADDVVRSRDRHADPGIGWPGSDGGRDSHHRSQRAAHHIQRYSHCCTRQSGLVGRL